MANFPSDVLTDIARGNQYLSILTQEYLADLKKGCNDCIPNGLDCLSISMEVLNNRVDRDLYDDSAKGNVQIMLKLIGDYILITPLTAYWWLSNEGDAPLTAGQIVTKNTVTFNGGSPITVVFTGLTYKRINIAYPSSEATKIAYVNVNDPADYGTIGTPSDIMGAAFTTGSFKQHNGNPLINGNRTLRFS